MHLCNMVQDIVEFAFVANTHIMTNEVNTKITKNKKKDYYSDKFRAYTHI
jgi:hypothetical protein